MNSSKTLIVFDIDGTLTDSLPVHKNAFKAALVSVGVSLLKNGFKEFKHHTDSYIAKEIYETSMNQKFTPELFSRFETALHHEILNHSIHEINGAKKVLEYLNESSEYYHSYATGSLHRPAVYKLRSINTKIHLDLLAAADELKEREQIVNEAIQKAKKHYQISEFDRIISVGDGLWDLKTAENLNLEFIGVGEENREILIENGMLKHTNDLTNFLEILKS